MEENFIVGNDELVGENYAQQQHIRICNVIGAIEE